MRVGELHQETLRYMSEVSPEYRKLKNQHLASLSWLLLKREMEKYEGR